MALALIDYLIESLFQAWSLMIAWAQYLVVEYRISLYLQEWFWRQSAFLPTHFWRMAMLKILFVFAPRNGPNFVQGARLDRRSPRNFSGDLALQQMNHRAKIPNTT